MLVTVLHQPASSSYELYKVAGDITQHTSITCYVDYVCDDPDGYITQSETTLDTVSKLWLVTDVHYHDDASVIETNH